MTKLKAWCEEHGISISQLARDLRISRTWASSLVNGGACSTKLMRQIQEYTNGEIKILDFFE